MSRGYVRIGKDCEVADTAVLIGPLDIGDRCRIGHGCVIGSDGEHRSTPSDYSTPIRIGSDSVLTDHVVVQRAVGLGGPQTMIGDGCYLMHGAHVAHNCIVSKGVTMSPFVVLGGHCVVLPYATLGIHSATHQHVTVGAYAMVGMGSMVLGDVPNFEKVVGVPARCIGRNVVAMERRPVSMADIEQFELLMEMHGGRRPMLTKTPA